MESLLSLQTFSCLEVVVAAYGVSRLGFLPLAPDHASVDLSFLLQAHARLGLASPASGLT